MIRSAAIFLSAAVISLLFTFPVLWFLSFFKLGQPIREEGPAVHQEKAGTPTMGGIGFLLAILALGLVLIDFDLHPQYLALLFLMTAFAAIGSADDLVKIALRRNLGLTFWQKIILQLIAAGFFAIYITFLGNNLSVTGFLRQWGFSNPYLYQLLLVFMVVGAANATNLTDGLNGLLAGTAGVAFLAFAVLAQKLGVAEALSLSLICSGAVFAFLFFNFPKAKVFMGDVGSLALGAALAGLAVILHEELRLIVIGGVFAIEALSVIIQVSSYKLFKRRIFKMTPLHHSFELMGIKETYIVVGFWVVAAILGVVGVSL